MKKISLVLGLALLSMHLVSAQQKPKYIFYMIGDGMGLNQVNLTEMYLAETEGRIGISPLVFSQFPVASFATSYSSSNGVTDSGAGGTALAVGHKTKNGVIGMDSTRTKPLKSIAYIAKEKGMKVGITTSVSIDHATPAAFYANQPDRNMYYEIANDIVKSNFDFFGGAGFLKPEENHKKEKVASIIPVLQKSGYTVAKGFDSYNQVKGKSSKIILTNNEQGDAGSLKYALDRKEGDLTLQQITKAAIESLKKDNNNGFFLMVEGGKIDWACHANDGATAVQEVLDFNQSVKEALAFYEQHPNETLIIVTADHETGGMVLGIGSSKLSFKNLALQKTSQSELSTKISALRTSTPNASWEQVKQLLSDQLGLWSTAQVSKDDEKSLHETYLKSFVNHESEQSKSLYATDDKLATLAVKALNKASTLGWGSGNHSASYIPIFAIGAGSEKFTHKMENIDIPKKVAELLGGQLD
ncbi:alkaline phosphatase [Sphingobacterium sp. SYP-B4668]|uniref:alkaline phosphatase n=1 Tax=Sphingobacterium sp. SYP-B4668 TaxID=2996035 RepID=UPI0022DE88A5|nr:alkaline phosphatase [Sphingobacterium sp. SYP-B4668]